jgi:hypothetical protein
VTLSLAAAAAAKFTFFEGAVFTASARLARRFGADRWLAIVAIDIAIDATLAQALSFAHLNSAAAYWAAAAALALYGRWPDLKWPAAGKTAAAMACLAVPLLLAGFRPVEEIDSINYLHYLIDWMANRATPYTFATYYVAFWELSFLPAWVVTGVDLFFPILALKAVAVLALAGWRVGRELDIRPATLAWTIFGAVSMRHYWLEYSGVPTLKNDALHGAGFLLLLLVVMRAARRRRLEGAEIALVALGLAFSAVKYSGVFTGGAAAAAIVWLTRDRRLLWTAPVVLLTSGHYYVRSLIRFGNPFYPFTLALGPLRLAGEGDLSYTSILWHARDPRVWRLLFAPEGGVSPAGLLFPAILGGGLVLCLWQAARRRGTPIGWGVLLILAGWMVYFRSVYGASAGRDDVAFLGNGLNSLRYVDGVLAATEIWLAAALGRFALPLAAVNAASRLWLVYVRLPFPAVAVAAIALGIGAVVWISGRRAAAAVAAVLLIGCPQAVERNRVRWTTYWNDMKPALDTVRGPDLAVYAINEASYYAGHIVAAGNPVDPRVRALMPEELAALAPADRPRYLAFLVTPGFDWRSKYLAGLTALGYRTRVDGENSALLELAK